MKPQTGLARVSTSSLERLREGLLAGRLEAPITRAKLVAFGAKEQLPALLTMMRDLSSSACSRIVDAVLAERETGKTPRPELVWTGPEGPRAKARDTAVVLRELLKSARRKVILAGYSFSQSDDVLAPLHEAMAKHGVTATFFVNIEQASAETGQGDDYGQRALSEFFQANWPFGPPHPTLYCDRRALQTRPWCSLHAKCVTVDGKKALISSANFTGRGQHFNIETGVLLHDPTFATELNHQWLTLIDEGLVYRWQPLIPSRVVVSGTLYP